MKHEYTIILQRGFGGITVKTKPVGEEEHRVFEILNHAKLAGKKMRIVDLVRDVNDLGTHEEHEDPRKKTSRRKMFQIIRNMRDAGIPVVGDNKGLWIAGSVYDVERFADHLERKARSDIASMLKLKRTMLSFINSDMPSLFDGLELEEEYGEQVQE